MQLRIAANNTLKITGGCLANANTAVLVPALIRTKDMACRFLADTHWDQGSAS
jgi:hypothetical protein